MVLRRRSRAPDYAGFGWTGAARAIQIRFIGQEAVATATEKKDHEECTQQYHNNLEKRALS